MQEYSKGEFMSVLEIILICVGCLAGLFLLWVFAGFVAYLSSLKRGGIAGKIINKKFIKELESYKIDYKWWDTVASKKVTIKAGKETLVATVLEKEGSKKVGICVHGYYGNFKDLNPWAKLLFENGFSVIAPNLRAHGESSGQYISMGFYDKDDIVLWIQKAIKMFGEDCEIVLFGESMGAATVLMVSELSIPKNVKCIIADSGYSNAYKELEWVVEKRGFLPAFLLLPVANFFSKIFSKCDLKKANPIGSVKKTTLPILFIHGEADNFVPCFMSKQMFEVSNKEKCSLSLFPGAQHIKSYATDTERYREILLSFIKKWLG